MVLNDLPPHLRLVLVMSDADEMPMSEAAPQSRQLPELPQRRARPWSRAKARGCS